MTPTSLTSATTSLDVRDVPPKHRFELIMNAYGRLESGKTLELVVDHDPTCMYYTLKADYGDAAFSFDDIKRGPETWRVHVTKHSS